MFSYFIRNYFTPSGRYKKIMHSAINEPFRRTFPSPDSLLYQIRRIFSEHINILCIETPKEWSIHYCRNERTIRNVCEEYSGLTSKQFLNLFHALNAAILSDCLLVNIEGYDQILEGLINNEVFYEKCCQYVLNRLDRLYGPRYLRKASNIS
jgi:hypothetical protein